MSRKKLIRVEVIRIKLANIADSVELVTAHIPSEIEEFVQLGLLKDGIYKPLWGRGLIGVFNHYQYNYTSS